MSGEQTVFACREVIAVAALVIAAGWIDRVRRDLLLRYVDLLALVDVLELLRVSLCQGDVGLCVGGY